MPSKPVYGLASGIPLCFYDCSFDKTDFEWNWDIDAISKVKNHLLSSWVDLQSKCVEFFNLLNWNKLCVAKAKYFFVIGR